MNRVAYSLTEVAEAFGFAPGPRGRAGEARVRRLIDSGQLRSVRVGRSIRVPASEIERLLSGEVAS
jgi:excisionase family DNA binding protein